MPEIFEPNLDINKPRPSEKEGVDNIYGRETFSPEKAKEYVESLILNFKEYYSSLGYKEEPAVPITSEIDPSVFFIGSSTNVLKKYLFESEIPSPGVFISQKCVRTRNVKILLKDNLSSSWGSYFTEIALMAPSERLHQASIETLDFFEKKLEIDPENMLIRINSLDKDLLSLCNEHFNGVNLEIDSRKIEYYRHKIGIDEIIGRNFNLALRDAKSDNFSDVGNFIIFEKKGKPLFTEIGFGDSTILKQLHGLEHVQDCTPVVGLKNIENEIIKRKFEDAIITSVALLQEGLRPFGQSNQSRILKKYIKSLSYFRVKTNITIDILSQVITDFQKREFPQTIDQTPDLIIEFIKAFELDLITSRYLSDDEKVIKNSLKAIT